MSGRKLLFVLTLVTVIAALVAACGPGGGGGGGGATQTVNVTGTEFSYSPNTITVKPGEKVTVNFKNSGSVQHTFVVPDLNFKLVVDPGQTGSGTFTAPSQAGTHQIHCDIAGHTEAGMVGTLSVQ